MGDDMTHRQKREEKPEPEKSRPARLFHRPDAARRQGNYQDRRQPRGRVPQVMRYGKVVGNAQFQGQDQQVDVIGQDLPDRQEIQENASAVIGLLVRNLENENRIVGEQQGRNEKQEVLPPIFPENPERRQEKALPVLPFLLFRHPIVQEKNNRQGNSHLLGKTGQEVRQVGGKQKSQSALRPVPDKQDKPQEKKQSGKNVPPAGDIRNRVGMHRVDGEDQGRDERREEPLPPEQSQGQEEYQKAGQDMEENVGDVIPDGIEAGKLVINHVGEMPDGPLQGRSPGKSQDLGNIPEALDDPVLRDEMDIVEDKPALEGIEINQHRGQNHYPQKNQEQR